MPTDPLLPRVVLTTAASVDGRITLGPHSRLMDPEVSARWETMKPPSIDELFERRSAELGATVTLEGSGSLVGPDYEAPEWPAPSLSEEELRQDWLSREAPSWYAFADSRGRVRWQYTGDETVALLVLVCAATPAGYLQFLRDMDISYFVVGENRVDLRLALQRIKSVLGADLVVADSGGTINASLLREGLVDEIDVITLPGIVGGAGTPSIVDGPPLADDELPIRLELLSVDSTPDGVVRTRYKVVSG